MTLEKETLRKRMSQKTKQLIQEILGRQKNPPAFLFFVLYIYKHNYSSFEDQQLTALILSILFYLIFSYNMFYFFNPLFNNPVFSVINLTLGIISANEKWKIYLFIFVIGDSLNISYEEPIRFYTILASAFICLQTYNNLIFSSIQDCKVYFAGFFSIMIFQLCSFAQKQFQMTDKISYSSILFSVLTAYFIMNSKLVQIKNLDEQKFKDARIFNHRINLQSQDLKKKYLKREILENHQKKCKNLHCFCKRQSKSKSQNKNLSRFKYNNLQQFYLTKTYYQKGIKLNLSNNSFLIGQFINFLLINGQISQAIFVHSQNQTEERNLNLFGSIQRVKLNHKIKQEIKIFDYQNIYNKQFEYVFKYDKVYLQLAYEIKQILTLKHDFWMQTAKEQSLMAKLQQIGSQIVERMYDLNHFYHSNIAKIQDKVKTYNGTILYAMYLLSTTNYKQFAQILIKKTSRNLESVKIHQTNNSQLFGLKISLRPNKNSLNQKVLEKSQSQRLVNNQENENKGRKIDQEQQQQIDEIITNISGSFCKLLSSSKSQILGSNISVIIPCLYRKKHHQKITNLIGIRYDENQVQKLLFLNKVRQIQFRTVKGRLINGKVAIKIFNQFNKQISFIAAVSITQTTNSTVIVSLEGVVHEFQQNLKNVNLIKQEEVYQIIESLRNQWKSSKSITTTKKMLAFQNNYYTLQFSSPYQQSFIDSPSEDNEQQPPVHIQIVSQQVGRTQTMMNLKNKEANNCLLKIEQKFCTGQNSSNSSSGSGKSSIVTVLSTFSQSYFIPFYAYIMCLFFIILLSCLLVIGLGSMNLNLAWNNSSAAQNPIKNLFDVSNLKLFLVRALNHVYDYQEYTSKDSSLNTSLINSYYGENYSDYYLQQMKRTFKNYNDSIILFAMDQSLIFSDLITQLLDHKIPVSNPYQQNPQLKVQHLSIHDLFMNLLVDLYQLSIGKSFNKMIMSFSYWGFMTKSNPGPQFIQIIKQSIQQTSKLIMIFTIIICALIPFTIIPLYIIFKEKIKNHVKIYDLVVSIQGELIFQQLKKIQSIIQIVVRANQASQVLKTNTEQYEARKRSSVIIKNYEHKNQMIQGLVQTKQKKQNNSSIFKQLLSQVKIINEKKPQTQKKRFSTSYINDFRKRGGQLNLKNSQADPRRPEFKNWIIYFLVLSTLYFLICISLLKIQNFNSLHSDIDTINDMSELKTNQSLLLLNQKLYFRGTKSQKSYFNGQTLISWLNNQIYTDSNILKQDNLDSAKQFLNCPGLNQYQFCKQKYTVSILRYQLTYIIKNSFEVRNIINQQYNLTADNFSSLKSQKIKSFSQLFFYAQTLNDRIQNITLDQGKQIIQKMLNQNKQMSVSINNYIGSGIIWGFFSFVLGLWVINYMKKAYLKEIMIVSFLNTQMISKNKRVQSFLQTLSKSSN